MALETMRGIHDVDGFTIVRTLMDDEGVKKFCEIKRFVEICESTNTISFTLQNGPVKECGINGCQVDTLIAVAKIMLEKLNGKLKCAENEMAVAALDDAVGFLKARKLNREIRGVEGTNQA